MINKIILAFSSIQIILGVSCLFYIKRKLEFLDIWVVFVVLNEIAYFMATILFIYYLSIRTNPSSFELIDNHSFHERNSSRVESLLQFTHPSNFGPRPTALSIEERVYSERRNIDIFFKLERIAFFVLWIIGMFAFTDAFTKDGHPIYVSQNIYWWTVILFLLSLSVRCALPMLFCLSLLLWVPLALASYALIMSEENESNNLV